MSASRIDAHMHLWNFAEVSDSWIASRLDWRRDFTPQEYTPMMPAAGISRAILVQAVDSPDETRAMLDRAATETWIAGVIGWADLGAKDIARQIAELAAHPSAIGIRTWPMIQKDPDWIASPALDAGFGALADSRLRHDTLAKPENLSALIRRIERTPGLRVCVNHCAYPLPDWAKGGSEEQSWIGNLSALAQLGCTVKLSGFGHKSLGQWRPQIYDRAVDLVLQTFGAERTIWASNWPTVVSECSFADWWDASLNWTRGLTEADRDEIFGLAACRFYGLPTT